MSQAVQLTGLLVSVTALCGVTWKVATAVKGIGDLLRDHDRRITALEEGDEWTARRETARRRTAGSRHGR